MSTSGSRVLVRAIAFASVLGLLALTPTATAKPPTRPGTPTDLSVGVTAAKGGYQLASTWKAGLHTTSFKVAMTNAAGTVLASDTLSGTVWTAKASAPANTRLTVTVTPYNGTRKGPAVAKSVVTPDVTGPKGSYVGNDNAFVGTLHQAALSDDVSAVSAITRTVNWGDGSKDVAWTSDQDLTHTYAGQGRYVATVTLTDESDNATVVEVPIVINDHAAPTGSYSLAPLTGWASLTAVTLTEGSLADDFSPRSTIARVVTWGDGTQSTWTGTTPLTHVYKAAGAFTPQVAVTDETGNAATIASSTSTKITADTIAPAVRLTLPRKSKRPSATSWKLLKGKATDAGTGVASVTVRAVQKRGTRYYAYRPATKRWVRAGTSLAVALQKARPARAVLAGSGWSAGLSRVGLGTLVYQAAGVDKVGNKAKALTYRQKVTRR
jgi:hypothetical protein